MVLPMVCEKNLLEESQKILIAAERKLVIIGIGSPTQDILAQKLMELDGRLEVLCVGAAVEFLAGTQKPTPAVLRQVGLEWLWRLTTNFPVTLPRVTVTVVGFLALVVGGKVKR